jgi:hypothetical protein
MKDYQFKDPLRVMNKTVYISLDKNGDIDEQKTRKLLEVCIPEMDIDKDLFDISQESIYQYFTERKFEQALVGLASSNKYAKIVFQRDLNEV